METQLEEIRKRLGSLIGFETTGTDGGVVLHVKKAILPTRPQQEYIEVHFDSEGKFKYFL